MKIQTQTSLNNCISKTSLALCKNMNTERKNMLIHSIILASLFSFCQGFVIEPQTRLNIRTLTISNNDHLTMHLSPSEFLMTSSLLSGISDPTATALDPSLEAEILDPQSQIRQTHD